MNAEVYNLLVNQMGHIVAEAESYPEHLQATVVNNLCKAYLSNHDGNGNVGSNGRQAIPSVVATGVVADQSDEPWDYERALIQLASEKNIDMTKLNGKQFATFVAYVFKVQGPKDRQEDGISADILVAASRTADRRLPGKASATLSNAKQSRLLNKAKGTSGYTIAPKGENFIYDLLNGNGSE